MKQQRQHQILEMIEAAGSITVTEISERLSVSTMTARRDLDDLATAGLLRRHHGGASQNLGRAFEPPFRQRATQGVEAKDAIGKFAASLVRPGDAIGIDVGTTALSIVPHLDAPNITIVTASLRVAMEVANRFVLEQDLRLILLGGVVRGDELSLVGGIAKATLDRLRLDRSFIGVGAINPTDGATEFNLEDAEVKQALVEVSGETIVLAGADKLNDVAFTKVAEVGSIDHLVVDEGAPAEILEDFRNRGVEVTVVSLDPPTVA